MNLNGVEAVRIRCFRELHTSWKRGRQVRASEASGIVERAAQEYLFYTGRIVEDASGVRVELEEVIADLGVFLKEHSLTMDDLSSEPGRVRYVREWHKVLPPLMLSFR